MAKMDVQKKKCITPEFRVSFPAVFRAKAFQDQEAKFSLVMIFDENADLTPLKKAVRNAVIEKWGDNKEKWPKKLRYPFRDGVEREDTAGYGAGKIFASASSKTAPGLVDQTLSRIVSEGQFYAGCWARAEVIAFAYEVAGNKGVSFSLQNIQKTRDDKAFSGRKNAEDVFDSVEDSSDDESAYPELDDDDMGLGAP